MTTITKQVRVGDSVSIQATPNGGHTFTSWSAGGSQVSTSNPYTFTPEANTALSANFSALTPITVETTGTDTIYLTNNSDQTYTWNLTSGTNTYRGTQSGFGLKELKSIYKNNTSYSESDNKITSINLGDSSISVIPYSAFQDCTALTSFTFASSGTSLSIGKNSFRNCDLRSLVLPSYLTEIVYDSWGTCGNLKTRPRLSYCNPFSKNSNLASITMPTSNSRYYVSGNCLIDKQYQPNCKSGDTANKYAVIVGCNNSVIPTANVSVIGAAAFRDTNITTITIPANIRYIETNAFLGATLNTVSFDLSNTELYVGESAFHDNNFTSIVFPGGLKQWGEWLYSYYNPDTRTGDCDIFGSATVAYTPVSSVDISRCSTPPVIPGVKESAWSQHLLREGTINTIYIKSGTYTQYDNDTYGWHPWVGYMRSKYVVDTDVDPANSSTVSKSASEVSVAPGGVGSVQLTATPNTGYTFRSWKQGSTVLSTSNPYTASIAFDAQESTFTAYSEVSTYTISASVDPSASGSISGTGTYNYGASCTLTATAGSGYEFTGWSESGSEVSSSNPYSFTVNSDRTLVANFQATITPLTITATDTDTVYLKNKSNDVYTWNLTSGTNTYSGTETGFELDNLKSIYKYTTSSGVGNTTTITSIDISGTSITEIPDYAFYRCSGLTSITMPDTITSLGQYAFYGSRLTSFSSSSITSIGQYAFYGSRLTSFSSSSTTSIGEGCFYDSTSLTTVSLPNLTSVPYYGFRDCTSLTTITMPNITQVGSYGFYNTKISTLPVDTSTSTLAMDSYAFSGTKITSVNLGSNSGGDSVFSQCKDLTSVVLGSNANLRYRSSMFANCTSLTSITFNGTTGLSSSMFFNCTSLTSITIPSTMTYMGQGAFSNCTGLETVYLEGTTPPTLDTNYGGSFNNTTCDFIVPRSALNTYKANSTWSIYDASRIKPSYSIITASSNNVSYGTVSGAGNKNYGTTCTLVATAESGGYEFVNWTENSVQASTSANYSFTVSDDRTLVANFALNPSHYTISASSNNVSYGTVSGGGSYTEGQTCTLVATSFVSSSEGYEFVNWTENGTEVSTDENYSFTVNSNRTLVANFKPVDPIVITANGNSSVILVNKDTTNYTLNLTSGTNYYYGDQSGFGLKDLKGIKKGNNVQNITSIDISGTSITEIPHEAFRGSYSGYPGITSISFPSTLTSIGSYSFDNCRYLATFTIPSSVNSIGIEPFYYTAWLNNQPSGILYKDNVCLGYKGTKPTGTLSITSGTRLISYNAFEGCSGLTSLVIPDSVMYINNKGFYGCSGLAQISIGATTPPTLGSNVFYNSSCTIYVPSSALNTYKAASGWSDYASRIHCLYTISASSNNVSYGTVSGGGSWTDGSTCTLTATANEGYSFVNWTENGTSVSTSSTYSFTATQDRTLVANFSAPPAAKITATANASDVLYIMDSDNIVYTWNLTSGTNILNDGDISGLDFSKIIKVYKNTSDTTAKYQSTGLTSLDLSEITSITGGLGRAAFYRVGSLTSIILPPNLTGSLSYYALGATSITSIDLPEGITGLGEYALFSTKLTEIKSKSITTLQSYSLGSCLNLEKIILPMCKTISQYALNGIGSQSQTNGVVIKIGNYFSYSNTGTTQYTGRLQIHNSAFGSNGNSKITDIYLDFCDGPTQISSTSLSTAISTSSPNSTYIVHVDEDYTDESYWDNVKNMPSARVDDACNMSTIYNGEF